MAPTTSRFHPDQRGALWDFTRMVARRDGEPALSEYKELRLDGRIDARERVGLGPDGSLIGYGQAAWHRSVDDEGGHWAFEIVVHPDYRDGPTAATLIEDLRLESEGTKAVLWARRSYVAEAARAAGWCRDRELLEMRRPLPVDCAPGSRMNLVVESFRIGVDERAWLAANNAAFTGHPENGSMTRRDLEHRISQAWFDPEGFLVAWDAGEIVGSCWTKIHDDGVGEIYIVGVVPAWKGKGVGRDLTCRGLDYLGKARHLTKAKLFVEAENERAVAVYAGLGFETTRIIEAFRYPE